MTTAFILYKISTYHYILILRALRFIFHQRNISVGAYMECDSTTPDTLVNVTHSNVASQEQPFPFTPFINMGQLSNHILNKGALALPQNAVQSQNGSIQQPQFSDHRLLFCIYSSAT